MIDAALTQGGIRSIPEVLVRFRGVVGLGSNYGPYEQEGARMPVYRWRLTRPDDVRTVLHVLDPWLGSVKRSQARSALMAVDAQPTLARGRPEWGSHKTHCIHGHEYAFARLRSYVSRGGTVRRASKQCLVCSREQARVRRANAR
ncbi:MAG: hypothetical protein ACYC9W_00050 [Candidatus Limnocylindria bacterium]